MKKALTQEQGAEALKILTYKNHILAASLRSNLKSGFLRFRSDIPKLKNSKQQSKQSSSKQTAQKRAKRPRVQDSTTTSEDHLTPLCPEPKKLTAKTLFIPPSSRLPARLRKIFPKLTEERYSTEKPTSSGAGLEPPVIKPVVDLILSSSSSEGVILSPIAISSPTIAQMEPPAQAGTLEKHHMAKNSPMIVTQPETKKKSKLDQPSPKKGKTTLTQKSRQMQKNPSDAPTSSKLKKTFQILRNGCRFRRMKKTRVLKFANS